MQTIQQLPKRDLSELINSISVPKGVYVLGLTAPTGKYQLDISQQLLDKLVFETDILGQLFPKLIPANPNELNISEVTHVGYTPTGKKKAKIVTPKLVNGKLTF